MLESMSFPDTVLSIAVEPKSQADIAKLDNGLAKLAEEDPTFTSARTSRAARRSSLVWVSFTSISSSTA